MEFFARRAAFDGTEPPLVIAEAGVNHNGDPALARRLVDAAAAAGADVVKFQAFRTEREISRFAALAPYQREGSQAQGQYELCKALELPGAALKDLQAHCSARGIGFLCSVFDEESLAFLADELKVAAVKLGSGELTNAPFLERIARLGLGVILSTGACTLDEVAEAVQILRSAGCRELVLMHCVSSYPAPEDELNLRAIATLRQRFALPVGFSDHSIGTDAAVAAVALGAVAIEKHLTLDRAMAGPDHKASAESADLARLARGARLAWRALGDGEKRPAACELDNLPLIRKGLVANGRLPKGARLTREMIEIKRPAHGIAPRDLPSVIGRELARGLEHDEPITWTSLV